MSGSAPRLVWYASYGSNCSLDRFLLYLRGGAIPGTDRHQVGARNPADPRADESIVFGSSIAFAGWSKTWAGAPAFLEHRPADGTGALGRRYLITEEQFGDVVAQESGRPIGSALLPDLCGLQPGSRTVIGTGRYDALLALDPVDGVPCFSFTSPEPPETRDAAPPSAPYLRNIVAGLAAVHDRTPQELGEHLCQARGMTPTWDPATVAALLDPSGMT